MMKKIYFVFTLLLSASMTGCIYEKTTGEESEKPPIPPPPPPAGENVLKLTATLEDTPLKRQNMGSADVGLFVYKNLVTPIVSHAKATLQSDASCEYTLETKDTSGYCFAYYPYQSTALSGAAGTTYTGMISATQDQTISTSTAVADVPASLTDQLLLISEPSQTIRFADQRATIQFKNVFSLFCFKITSDVVSVGFDHQRIRQFEIYMADRNDTLIPLDVSCKLSGTYTIDLRRSLEATGSGAEFSSAGSSAKITVRPANLPVIPPSGAADAPLVVWVVVPPFHFYSNKLVVRMETENGAGNISYRTFSTFEGRGEIKRNTLTTFDVHLTEKNVYTDDVPRESFAEKPANSYVISETGVYEIAAKKTDGTTFPDAASVDWLWASKAGGGNDFAIDELLSHLSLDAEAQTIRFRVGAAGLPAADRRLTEGNVVLALRDASKKILWTWHLWMTDKPGDVNHAGRIFMDRNIGALSADTAALPVDTYGLVYQWGRKDPFIGGDGQTADEATAVLSVARAHTITNHSGGGAWDVNMQGWSQADRTEYGTVGRAVNYPMTFIYNSNSSSGQDPADWLSVSDRTLWADHEKTNADPCPYGYKVPGRNDVSGLYSGYQNYLSQALPSFWFYNKNSSNRYWEVGRQGVTDAFWPVTGMRQGRHAASGRWLGGQLKYAGTNVRLGHGYYWTSTPWDAATEGGAAGDVALPPPPGGASYNIMMRDRVLYEITYGPNADAYPVRCVKMEDKP
jgi:hypothetical protein